MVELNQTADTLTNMVTTSADSIVASVAEWLPIFIVALLVFVVGWILAIIVSGILRKLLNVIKFEELLKAYKVSDALGTVKLSNVLVKLTKYYILLIFLTQAVMLLQLAALALWLGWFMVVLGSLLIVLAAFLLGEYVKKSIMELSKSPAIRLCGRAVKLIAVYIGVVMALGMVGFDTMLLNSIFVTMLQAIVFGLALAFGLAFGFGAQEDAKDVIKQGRKHFKI